MAKLTNIKASEVFRGSRIRSIYNLRHELKKLNPKSKLLDKTVNKTIKSTSDYNKYKAKLHNTIFKEKQKRDKRENKKLYYKRGMEYSKYVDPLKYAKLKRDYLKQFKPDEYKNQRKELDRAVKVATEKKLKSDFRTNEYGFRKSKYEIKEFYKMRDKYNRKVKKLLEVAKNNDPKLYDYIMGTVPDGLKVGNKYRPSGEWDFSQKDRDKFEYMFDNSDWNKKLIKYNNFIDSDMDFDKYFRKVKMNVFQIFNTGKYSNIDSVTMDRLMNKALAMDMPTFMMWYANNKDRIQEYYDNGRLDDLAYSDNELLDEVLKIEEKIDFYIDKTRGFYGY